MNRAHYRGDHTDIVERGEIMGPDTAGAYYTPISAAYDPGTGLTTVEFRWVPLEEITARSSVRA